MCASCFLQDYDGFDSELIWVEFDLQLTKKLGREQMRFCEFKPDGVRDKDDGQYVYECVDCKQKWELKDPDHAMRGYFRKV